MIVEFTPKDNLDALLHEHNKVIIDIYATWCGPCKMLATQLEAFVKNHNDWTIIRIDCDTNQKIAQQFAVQAIPTMVIIKDGKMVETIVGFKPLIEIEKITSKY